MRERTTGRGAGEVHAGQQVMMVPCGTKECRCKHTSVNSRVRAEHSGAVLWHATKEKAHPSEAHYVAACEAAHAGGIGPTHSGSGCVHRIGHVDGAEEWW